MSGHIFTPWIASALTALALAACGGSSSSSSSHAASTTSATSTAPSSTVSGTTAAPTSSATTTSQSSSAAIPAPAATSTALPQCTTSHLRLSFVSGNGAAGTAYFTYQLANRGGHTCVMFGYPGVAILNSAGRIVQHPAKRGIPTSATVTPVTLLPGQHARFIVVSSDVIPSPGCQHAWTGATIQVFPPNQRAALSIPRTGQFCNLRVGPVQPTG